jgi:RimJ/RimL family protein N-acetyltransferase
VTDLVHLSPADIPEVMRIERLPGYEEFVGRFTDEEHAAEMACAQSRYFGLREDGRLLGFVILQDLAEPRVLLRRIAVDDVGRGVGTRLLRGVLDWVFETTDAEAVTLDVYRGNPRARRVYDREGFVYEREDEVHVYMALQRARWARLKASRLDRTREVGSS